MIKIFRIVPFLILISVICFYPVTSVYADGENENTENELAINISPKDNLFDISNMKPGDWAPRTITVENSGSKDFVYQMQLENSGEEKLFNELLVEIKAGDTELYQGKLAALESLPERKLTSSSKENIDITIRFPEHLGNDFQGLKSAFAFSFTAEGSDNTVVQTIVRGEVASSGIGPTSAGFSLPSESTVLFNLIFVGTLLVAGGIILMIIRYYKRVKVDLH